MELSAEEWQAVRLSLDVALRSVALGLVPAVLMARIQRNEAAS